MSNRTARTLVSAFLVSIAAAGALGTSARAATVPADQHGYSFRSTDAFTDGARKVDTFTDGARDIDAFTDGARKADAFADGAHKVAGLNRVGVSATPARSADPYLDGARGAVDVFTDGAAA
jgi:hypothetical protein